MDELEYDIYDDLDVFKGDDKQQKECESCTELREQLNDAQRQNAHLTNELNEIQKNYEALEVNSSALLKTARQEIQRKDTRIKDLQKEKDDILFRRKKVKSNIESKDATTQSKISCKPHLLYELKHTDSESSEKSTERNNRLNENHKNHTNNPFASKSKENHDVKTNHLRNLDKNSSHRHQSWHQDEHISLRSRHSNHRPKENERHEQINDVERTKRKRSPSVTKEHKRMRRSRSRSRQKRDRDRNVIEQNNSPDKVSHSLKSKEKVNGSKEEQKRRSPHQSPDKHDLRSKIRNKREKKENHLHRHATENHVEHHKKASKDLRMSDEAIATEHNTESTDTEIERMECEMARIKALLEEGEIEDSSCDIDNNFKPISHEPTDSKVSPNFERTIEMNGHNVREVESEIQEKKIDISKLVATAKAHIPHTTPILLNHNNCVQQQDQQKQCQLSNGIAHDATEVIENVAEKLNGIPMETQSLGDVDDKGNIPFVNKCEIIDVVNDHNQQKSIVEDESNGIAQPQDEIVPKLNLENKSQPIESIPQINDCQTNLTKSHSQSMIDPNDDSSNSTHNTSGSRSVNISTSYKDYLIVENDNNEQIIYVTRKKRKKTKKSKENV